MRCDFDLPAHDVEFLSSTDWDWETVRDGTANWLLLHQFVVPPGYSQQVVTAALRIEPGYSDTQIDMVYFNPSLARTDGRHVGGTDGTGTILGQTFQRWSRHRTGANPWRPGLDDVSTHIALVRHWLEREFVR